MFKSLRDLFYPPRCPLCDELRENRDICIDCIGSVQFLEGDFTAPHLDRVWFDRARSCFAYEGKIMDAIHGLKYSQRFDLIKTFTGYLEKEIKAMGAYDVIIPVPLHWWRLLRRGYNQSAIMARATGKKLAIKVDCNVLKKTKNIVPQVGLDRNERLKNVRGAFEINSKLSGRIKDSKILLIDDVLTTGATVNECAKTLIKNARCGSVDVLTIARTI